MYLFPSFKTLYPRTWEKAMAPHSSTLAWEIPRTEEPGRLQSMGSLRVWHDWVTSLSFFTFMHWRRKWQPTPVFFPGESQGRGAWWSAVYGGAWNRTWLKRLSRAAATLGHQDYQTPFCILTPRMPVTLWVAFLFIGKPFIEAPSRVTGCSQCRWYGSKQVAQEPT